MWWQRRNTNTQSIFFFVFTLNFRLDLLFKLQTISHCMPQKKNPHLLPRLTEKEMRKKINQLNSPNNAPLLFHIARKISRRWKKKEEKNELASQICDTNSSVVSIFNFGNWPFGLQCYRFMTSYILGFKAKSWPRLSSRFTSINYTKRLNIYRKKNKLLQNRKKMYMKKNFGGDFYYIFRTENRNKKETYT